MFIVILFWGRLVAEKIWRKEIRLDSHNGFWFESGYCNMPSPIIISFVFSVIKQKVFVSCFWV